MVLRQGWMKWLSLRLLELDNHTRISRLSTLDLDLDLFAILAPQ
jgi:hypothetical protein